LWDEKLNGGSRVYGFADSDAHIKEMVGRLRLCVLADGLTQASIREAVHCGRFYGSNGPDLRFSIDSVQMGDSMSVLFKKKVHVSMTAYSCEGLDSVRLIKNGRLFRSYKYLNYQRRADMEVLDEVMPGDYYRLEVNDKFDQIAFSNPIFITYGEATGHYTDNPIILRDTVELVHHSGNFLYPNPAKDKVTLNFDRLTNGNLNILDEHGVVCYREALHAVKEMNLQVGTLPEGFYYVQVNDVRLKLMIKR
jgi:hypothetical protein